MVVISNRKLDGSTVRAVGVDEPVVRYLAGKGRGGGCAWCGSSVLNVHGWFR